MNKKRRKKMTGQNKKLLFKDLCARLPYGVRYKGDGGWGINPSQHTTSLCTILTSEEPLVYLRPMSSMTEEEKLEIKSYLRSIEGQLIGDNGRHIWYFDYLNAHHFDYRGLINKGLALVAPEDMYKNE